MGDIATNQEIVAIFWAFVAKNFGEFWRRTLERFDHQTRHAAKLCVIVGHHAKPVGQGCDGDSTIISSPSKVLISKIDIMKRHLIHPFRMYKLFE